MRRTRGRSTVRTAVFGAGLAALIVLASCSTGGSPSPTPTATKDASAVATALTTYLVRGIGGGDWATASAYSTGNLKVAAGWLLTQGISASESERGTFAIRSMGVSSMDGSSATLALDATQTGSNFTTTYTGPVSMVKDASGWKVADYRRNGLDAAGAVFPNASGTTTSAGVTITVVGAQLEAGHVDVWVRIRNDTKDPLSWDQPIVVVDPAGRQLGHGVLFVSSADSSEPFEMLPKVSAFGDFLVTSATLPLTTRTFRLLVGASDGASGARIDLSVPVTLR